MANILANPKFQALKYPQKKEALLFVLKQGSKWDGLKDPQKEEIFVKMIGPPPEQEQVQQKVNQPDTTTSGFVSTLTNNEPLNVRETTADAFDEFGAPLVESLASGGGTIAGTASPIPGGGAIGGALGYAGAKQGTRAISNLLHGENDGGFTAKNLITRPLQDIAEGATGEIIPAAITKGIGKSLAPLKSKFETKAIRTSDGKIGRIPTQEKANLMKMGKSKGIDFLPSDATGSKTIALFESFLDKLPGSSDIMQDFRLKAQLEPLLDNLEQLKRSDATEESIDQVGEKILDQVNGFLRKESTFNEDALNLVRDQLRDILGTKKPTFAIAEEAQDQLVDQFKVTKKGVRDKFTAARESLPDKPLDTPALEQASTEVLEEIEGLPAQSSLVKELANWVKTGSGDRAFPKELLEQVSQMDKKDQIEVLEKLSGSLGKTPKLLRGFEKTLNSLIKKEDALLGQGGGARELTQEGALYTKMKGAARSDLEKLAELDPKSDKLLKEAKLAHGEFADTFKTDNIRKLLKSKPKDFIDRIISKDNIKGVREVRKAIGDDGFKKVKQGLTNKLLGVGKNDVFDPKHLRRQLAQYEDDVLIEVYGKEAVAGFKQIADGGTKLLDKKPGVSFLKTLVKEYPETIVDELIGAEGSKISTKALIRNVKVMKQALSKKEFNALGDKLFEKIMEVDKHTNLIKPKTFAKTIEKYGDRLKGFYPEDKVEDLKVLASLGKDLHKAELLAGNPSGTAQMNIMWGILNMVRKLPTAKTVEKITTGLALFVPKKLAKFYTSPAGRKYLTEGYKVPKTIEEFRATAEKIATLSNIDLEKLPASVGIKSETKENK
ncbi:hypothetical protein [Pseudoalteromonas sp.]|uniref:hypothetical protein n=1 Tax=Pseudoalteromonas sp. TaxID=53249 RepID=UPI002628B9D2|nr:hypothetical protein [Pseudoalteromonas sp.]MCP4585320.1 hypothetical protein [Pseudoalteromonas sp.]